jgi:hypothetical protein
MTRPPDGILSAMESSPGVTPPPAAPGDPRLRFRVWDDGRLADEHWIDADTATAGDAEAAAARQAAIVAAAAEAGRPWLAEVYDPALPEGRAYLRWGTDTAGMVNPVAVPGDQAETTLSAAAAARYAVDEP